MANSTFAGMNFISFSSFDAQESAFITDGATSTEMSLGDWQREIYGGGTINWTQTYALEGGAALLTWNVGPYYLSSTFGVTVSPNGTVLSDLYRFTSPGNITPLEGGGLFYSSGSSSFRFLDENLNETLLTDAPFENVTGGSMAVTELEDGTLLSVKAARSAVGYIVVSMQHDQAGNVLEEETYLRTEMFKFYGPRIAELSDGTVIVYTNDSYGPDALIVSAPYNFSQAQTMHFPQVGYNAGIKLVPDDNGGFTVVWHGYDVGPGTTTGYFVKTLHYGSDMQPDGDVNAIEVLAPRSVYSTDDSALANLQVIETGGGAFTAFWISGADVDGERHLHLNAQEYDASGQPTGDTLVLTENFGWQDGDGIDQNYRIPRQYEVSMLEGGDIAVSWSDEDTYHVTQLSAGLEIDGELTIPATSLEGHVTQLATGAGFASWISEDGEHIVISGLNFEGEDVTPYEDPDLPTPVVVEHPDSYAELDGVDILHHFTQFDADGFTVDGPTDYRLASARSVHAFTVGDTQFLAVVSGGNETGATLYQMDANGDVGEGVLLADYDGPSLQEPYDVTSTVVGGKTYLLISDVDEYGIYAFEIGEDGSFALSSAFTKSIYDRSILGGGAAVATAEIEGQTFVFSIRPYTHSITSLKLDDNGVLSLADLRDDDGTWRVLPWAHLQVVQKNGETFLYSTGSVTAINGYSVANDGTLTPISSAVHNYNSSGDMEAVSIGGRDFLYYTSISFDLILIYEIENDGTLTAIGNISNTPDVPLDGAYGLGSFELDGAQYLTVSSFADNSLVFFRIGADGGLTYLDSIADTDAIALERAYDTEPFILNGTDRLFVAATAFGEGGFSIFEIGENAPLILTGTSAAEALSGTRFGDEISGAGGHDSLSGALGDDTLSGDDGDDTVEGEDGQDSLSGGTGNDLIEGGTGQDTLIGGAGADTMDGGADQDLLDYTASGAGVMADLSRGRGRAGDAEGDRFTDIEDVAGSAHNDTLVGDAGDNRLMGGNGFDFFDGGAGADYIHGGGDQDRVNYGASSEAVHVSLDAGRGYTGDAEGDVLIRIEELVGSDYNDTLEGSTGRNKFWGGDGDDLITANDGPDVLYGEAGNDTLDGGEGRDIIIGGTGNDSITGGLGNDIIETGTGSDILVYADGHGGDFITDFDITSDLLDLTAITGVSSFADLNAEDGRMRREDGVFLHTSSGDFVFIAGVSISEIESATIVN